jgi:hypothetical protein
MIRCPDQHVAPACNLVLLCLSEQRREPTLQDIVGNRVDPAVLDGCDPLGPEFRRSDLRRRAAECERLNTLGSSHGNPLPDHAPDGETDEGGPVDLQVIEESQKIVGMIVDAVRRGRRIREAVSALVVENDPEPIREGGNDLLPDAEIASERVDEDENRTILLPEDLIVQDDSVNACKCHASPQCSEPTPM